MIYRSLHKTVDNMRGDDLTTIGHFPTLGEASMARNRLESAGIPAVIADDYTLTTDPLLAGAMNFIKVQVRGSDAEQAAILLSERAPAIDPEEIGESDDETEGDQDKNGDDEDIAESDGERLVHYGYRAAMYGCISLPFILHLYSLYLLLKAAFLYPELSPASNRKFYIALVVDLAWIALVLMIIQSYFIW